MKRSWQVRTGATVALGALAVAGMAAVGSLPGSAATAAAGFSTIRMVVGPGFTDSFGHVWRTETGFIGGHTYTTTAPIAGAANPRLYQRERANMSGYDIPISQPGDYRVTLKEAEIWFDAPGKRVFDVRAEGVTKISNYDVFVAAGGKNRAHQPAFNVTVTDGMLNLRFVNRINHAKVGAIQVSQVRAHTGTPTPTPTATATPTATPTSPGTEVPRGDLPGWRQIFLDDFTSGDVPLGSWPGQYGSKWGAYPEGWTDTSDNGIYSPKRTLSIRNGKLDIFVHTADGQAYVAAPQPKLVSQDAGDGQLYGRYSVRFRADPVPGYKTAWLLWPDSDNWVDGEIDFPEGNLNGEISGFSHEVDGNPANNAFWVDTEARYTDWHIATIEWTSSGVTFYLDGRKLGTGTGDAVPHKPMHWVLQTETRLSGGVPDPAARGHVEIDWVAAWARV